MSRQQTHATVRCSPCVTGTCFLCYCTSHMSFFCRQKSGVSSVEATGWCSLSLGNSQCFFMCSCNGQLFPAMQQQLRVFCVQASDHMFSLMCRHRSGFFCIHTSSHMFSLCSRQQTGFSVFRNQVTCSFQCRQQ